MAELAGARRTRIKFLPPKPQVPAPVELLSPSHPSIITAPEPDTHPRRVPTTKHEWMNSLVPSFFDACDCVQATACPCRWVYASADRLLKENGRAVPADGCYGTLLSLMVCAPALFCIDRTATSTLNYAMDHREEQDEEEESDGEEGFGSAMYAMLAAAGFGARRAERRTPAPWTHDGRGFDVHEHMSEDWWPAHWCSYYMYHALCCGFLRCRFFNSARQTTPMCFALLCGAIYPICLCPSTFVLRRSVIASRNISESYFDSAARSLLCTPCSLVQTYREIEETSPTPSSSFAETQRPTTVQHI